MIIYVMRDEPHLNAALQKLTPLKVILYLYLHNYLSRVVSHLMNSYVFYLETLTAVRFSLLLSGSAINETTAQTFPINQDNSTQWFPALACMCYNVKHISNCLCLTCLTSRPWLHILSSRSHRLAMSVFSSRPVMFASPCPSSTASLPIFSTNIRLVWTSIDKQH